MRILTLNLNMFNYENADNEVWSYMADVRPDIALLQEVRANRLKKCPEGYDVILPRGYSDIEWDKIDSRKRITVALHDGVLEPIDYAVQAYDYTFVLGTICQLGKTISAVHMPLMDDHIEESESSAIRKAVMADIICGDFNADKKSVDVDTPSTANCCFVKELLDSGYESLWEKGRFRSVAYYINYRGEKLPACKDYRTFMSNTHIDYILAKKDSVKLNEIAIDLRTLAFSDHASVMADVMFK